MGERQRNMISPRVLLQLALRYGTLHDVFLNLTQRDSPGTQ